MFVMLFGPPCGGDTSNCMCRKCLQQIGREMQLVRHSKKRKLRESNRKDSEAHGAVKMAAASNRMQPGLTGCVVGFCLSAHFGRRRAETLSGLVRKLGGRVASGQLSTKAVFNREPYPTHVVVCSRRKSDVGPVGSARIVVERWLERSIEERRPVEVEPYVWQRSLPRRVCSTQQEEATPHRHDRFERIRASAHKWACQRPPLNVSLNAPSTVRDRVVAGLKEMVEIYGRSVDKTEKEWKALACGAVASFLERCTWSDDKLLRMTIADLKRDIPKCGDSLARYIVDLVQTGSCEKLDNLLADPFRCAGRRLTQVWGIGPKKAHELHRNFGVETVDDLRALLAQTPDLIPQRVQKALACYEDLLERIPRDETALIGSTIRQVAINRSRGRAVVAETVGSFRRGKADCGDVDVLITWCGYKSRAVERATFLATIVETLEQDGFLTYNLTDCEPPAHDSRQTTKRRRSDSDEDASHLGNDDNDEEKPASYMGICKLEHPRAKHRRLDIKVYDEAQWPFAMLYFTGSDHFNRSMRHFAKKCGYSLSDRGLRPRNSSKNSGIPCRTERDIFFALGLEYRPPHTRGAQYVHEIEEAMQRLERDMAAAYPASPPRTNHFENSRTSAHQAQCDGDDRRRRSRRKNRHEVASSPASHDVVTGGPSPWFG